MDLNEKYDLALSNVTSGMVEYLATKLKVSADAIERIGVGYFPEEDAWVFPERNEHGGLIGLLRRYSNGKKFVVKGSKRGLIFAVNRTTMQYSPGAHNWVRATTDLHCPICDRDHYCLIDASNPRDPSKVLCTKVSKGSKTAHPKAGGWIHELRPTIALSGRPFISHGDVVLIVEGASDTMAGMTLGLPTVGRAQALGNLTPLKELVSGMTVLVIGDNDAGVGKAGMETTAMNLLEVCKDVRTLMPPEGVKDLRGWLHAGVTKEELIAKAVKHSGLPSDVLVSDNPYQISEQWVNAKHTIDGVVTLRKIGKDRLIYDGSCYKEKSDDEIRSTLYGFLKEKKYQKRRADGSLALEAYHPSKRKLGDILDAACCWTLVPGKAPVWLQEVKDRPALSDLMVFKNGLFDVGHYVETGKVKMYPPDPRLFVKCCFPYELDIDAHSEVFELATAGIFEDDRDKTRLLLQWMGYGCVNDQSLEKFMIFRGDTRTGKGTILEAMKAMLGEDQWGATSFNQLGAKHGLTNCVGKLAAFMGDAKEPAKIHEDAALGRLLEIVGRDSVTIENKNVDVKTWRMTCRFTIAANHLPYLKDSAQAVEARALILEFANSFKGKEDTTIKDRLIRDASEGKLIPYALRGLRDLRQNGGRFAVPDSSVRALAEFRRIASPVTAFVDECCEVDMGNKGLTVTSIELYQVWKAWCVEQGSKPGIDSSFGRNLYSAVPFLRNQNHRPIIDGRRFKGYQGIRLQDWVASHYELS